MIRYNFLLYHADVESFMEHLRELGVVDITASGWQADLGQLELIARVERYKNAHRRFAAFKPEPGDQPFATTEEAVEAYEAASERYTQLVAARAKAESELDELLIWGQFEPADLERLRSEGIVVRFFQCAEKLYRPAWEMEYPIEIVARRDGQVWFVIAQTADTPPITIDATELRAPGMSFAQKEAQIESFIRQEKTEEEIFRRAALSRDAIREEYLTMQDKINFTTALHAGESYAEGAVKIVEGWSVRADRAAVEAFADSQQTIYTSEEAKAEQNPPIKLKNHFFARLYEPIGALYMLPRYNELDLTPFFAPFFMIFFGMCFGDAGYGIVFILALLILWKKIPVKFRDFAWLGLFLNLSAVVFGMLTGNVFGIELVKVHALAEFKDYFVSNNSMFNVAIGMGVAQVLFGQILRIFNRSKRGGSFVYGLSSLGWVILLVSLGIALSGMVDSFTMESIAFLVTVCAAGVLILFFNSPKKNPFVNFGTGLYNCYEMATGVVGDLVSYVRLFAIGLAGAIIAQVFNALSVGLSGDIPVLSWIFMIIILAIGHGLNVFVSALGAFVHPVRLTFVEFYKNAEFEGGGRKFAPLKRHKD